MDTPSDSGFFGSLGASGGLNVGAGVGFGYAFGDIEGASAGADINVPGFSVQTGVGEDGQFVIGGSLGVGIGGSLNETYTSTYAPFRRE